MNLAHLVERLAPQLDAVAKRRRSGSRDAAAAALLLEALEREELPDAGAALRRERAELARCAPK